MNIFCLFVCLFVCLFFLKLLENKLLLVSINFTPKTSNPVALKNGTFLGFPGFRFSVWEWICIPENQQTKLIFLFIAYFFQVYTP